MSSPAVPVPIGAWLIIGLWGMSLAYFAACVAHMLVHEIPMPH